MRKRVGLELSYRLDKALLDDSNSGDTARGGGGCWNPGDKGGILRTYLKWVLSRQCYSRISQGRRVSK